MKVHAKFKMPHLNISTCTADFTVNSFSEARRIIKREWPEAKNIKIRRVEK